MAHKSLFWELFRKTLHLSGLFILVFYTVLFHYFSEQVAILALTALLLLFLEIEYVRLEHRPKIVEVFEGLFRDRENDYLISAVFFVISCIIAFAAFEYWIATLAMLMTVFGDIFAAIFGKAFGKTKIFERHEKTYVGTLAGFAANLTVGFLAVPDFFYLALVMAIAASLVELFTNKLDDNLTVPLSAGFVGQMLVYYNGYVLPPVELGFLAWF